MGNHKHPFEEGTHVIVDWDDVGPQPCTIHKYIEATHTIDVTKTYHHQRRPAHYNVKTTKGEILYSSLKGTTIDKQYYRDKRLKQLLKK